MGDWATDEIGAGPLGGLQHVALTASVTLEGVTRCVSSWDGKAKRQEGSATVSASVLLVRPQLEGLDRDWRIERLDLDDAAVYAPYPDGAYGAEQAFELG